MSNNTGPQQGPAAAPQRPSLMGAAPPAGSAEKQLSVLAALDGKPPAPVGASRGATPWLAGLGLLVAAAIGAAWALRGAPNAAPAQPATLVAEVPAPAPVAATPAPPVAVAEPAAPASAAVARLEELPAPAASAASAAEPAVAEAASAPRQAKAARSKDKPAQVAKADAKPRAKEKDRSAKPKAKPAPEAPVLAAAPAAAASAAGKDADVDLIAALVQHMNREAKGTELTIADLVARCKSLQGGEAQRCQRRICENYWGRAEACPRAQAPNEVAARP